MYDDAGICGTAHYLLSASQYSNIKSYQPGWTDYRFVQYDLKFYHQPRHTIVEWHPAYTTIGHISVWINTLFEEADLRIALITIKIK